MDPMTASFPTCLRHSAPPASARGTLAARGIAAQGPSLAASIRCACRCGRLCRSPRGRSRGAHHLKYALFQAANIPTPRDETLVFTQSTNQVWDSFNPYIPNGEAYQYGVNQACREGMFYVNFVQGKVIPWLALSHEYNADFTGFTLNLNPAAIWSDGQPYTSDDVVFSINLLKDNTNFNGADQIAAFVDTVTATDPHTVVFKLKAPNPRFHYLFTIGIVNEPVRVVPKHVWEKPGRRHVQEQPADLHRTLRARSDDPRPVHAGLEEGAQLLEQGQSRPQTRLLHRAASSCRQTPRCRSSPTATLMCRSSLPQHAGGQGQLLRTGRNSTSPIPARAASGSIRTRRAVSSRRQRAAGRSPTCSTGRRSATRSGIRRRRRPSTRGLTTRCNERWTNADIADQYPLDFNLDKAGQLLDSIGATKNGDKRQLNGKDISLTLITPTNVGDAEYQIGTLVATNAKKVGIDIQVKALPGTPFNDAYQLGDYDLTSHWLCGVALDPNQLYGKFLDRQYKPVGTRTTQDNNETRTQIPALNDAALKLEQVNPEDPANKALFDTGLQAFMANLPAMPSMQSARSCPRTRGRRSPR